jgi:hypothetical protein
MTKQTLCQLPQTLQKARNNAQHFPCHGISCLVKRQQLPSAGQFLPIARERQERREANTSRFFFGVMSCHTRYGKPYGIWQGENAKGETWRAGYGMNGRNHASDSGPADYAAFPPAWLSLPHNQNDSFAILAQFTCKPLAYSGIGSTISFRCYQKLS